MVSCYLVLALASTWFVVCCLLTGCGTRSLRPPWSGVSAMFGAPHPITCVLRRWPGPGPGVQATEQFRISRCGKLANRLEFDQTRQAWLTPATPSEQPDDSGRVLRSDQILAIRIGALARARYGRMTSTARQAQPAETLLAPNARRASNRRQAPQAERPLERPQSLCRSSGRAKACAMPERRRTWRCSHIA